MYTSLSIYRYMIYDMYVYIYIYIERERDREREHGSERDNMGSALMGSLRISCLLTGVLFG